eukprot:4190082-Amphidinium_carterae.1
MAHFVVRPNRSPLCHLSSFAHETDTPYCSRKGGSSQREEVRQRFRATTETRSRITASQSFRSLRDLCADDLSPSF